MLWRLYCSSQIFKESYEQPWDRTTDSEPSLRSVFGAVRWRMVRADRLPRTRKPLLGVDQTYVEIRYTSEQTVDFFKTKIAAL